MLGAALGSIAIGIFDIKHYMHLQLVPHISRYHQVSVPQAVSPNDTNYSNPVLAAILTPPSLRQLQ